MRKSILSIICLALCLVYSTAFALSPAQMATLKAHIEANTNTIEYGGNQVAINALPNDNDSAIEIAKWYSLEATPAYWVWRTCVTEDEVVQETSRTGTTFVYVTTGFIGRTVQELMTWNIIFKKCANPSLVNVRQAFIDILNGSGNAASNRAHLDVVARRKATNVEKLFATGNGTDTAANAGTLAPKPNAVEGPLSGQDVYLSRNP